ncbi:hypothetical protein, partial [Methanopyrus sp.]
FWAVNGREGEACPVGPYMLVRTGGKPAHLHYVAWERYQSRAYEVSVLLLALSVVGVTCSELVRGRPAKGSRATSGTSTPGPER